MLDYMGYEQHDPLAGTSILAEGNRGFGTLLKDDRTALAAYSNTPSFDTGVKGHNNHPIHSAKQSMFNLPGVVEALEIIYDETHPETSQEGDPKPVAMDATSAIKRLSALRKHATKADSPVLVQLAIDIGARLEEDQAKGKSRGDQNAPHQRPSDITATAGRLAREEEARDKARREAEQAARQEEKLEREMRQTAQKQLFLDRVDELEKIEASNIKYEALRLLSEELVVVEEGATDLVLEEKPPFHPAIRARVQQYLREPHLLLNDLRVLKRLTDTYLPYKAKTPATQTTVNAYSSKIKTSLEDRLSVITYPTDSFNSVDVEQWLRLADGSAAKDENLAATLVHGQKILVSTLEKFAHDEPKQFIDKLYMTAYEGLDPDDQARLDFTIGVLKGCLGGRNYAEAGLIIEAAIDLPFDQDALIKVIDLEQTLELLGHDNLLKDPYERPTDETGRIIAAKGDGGLSRAQLRIVRMLYPNMHLTSTSMLRGGRPFIGIANPSLISGAAKASKRSSDYKNAVRKYEEYRAAMPAGQDTSLLGRFKTSE